MSFTIIHNGNEQLTLIDLALPIKLYQDQYFQSEVLSSQSILAFGQAAYLAPECLQGELPSKSQIFMV